MTLLVPLIMWDRQGASALWDWQFITAVYISGQAREPIDQCRLQLAEKLSAGPAKAAGKHLNS